MGPSFGASLSIVTDPDRALSDLIAKHRLTDTSSHLNEAATRLLVIDVLLSDVLGWPKASFHPEEPVTSLGGAGDRKQVSWLDYHLADPSTPRRLVVEAKRTGTTFSLGRTRKRRVVPITNLLQNHGEHLREAIQQARNYCINAGTDAFVVTNGNQWIGSIAYAHTIPLEALQGVVFDSLEDIYDNLAEFMDLFSPTGISEGHLAQIATGSAVAVPSFAQRLHGNQPQTQRADKNYLVAPLQMLMKLCFSDLTGAEHTEMLEQCYVPTDASAAALRNLEAFVGANLPLGLENSQKLDRFDDGPSPFPEPLGVRGGTVLLAGRAGSGKSTFLAHTRRRLKKQFANHRHVVLLCDLLDKTEIHAARFDHERFISEVAEELLKLAEAEFPELSPYAHENLREIFHGEIRRREASMDPQLRGTGYEAKEREELIQKHVSQPLAHLKAYLGYLDRQKYSTTILLDNVDRGTEEFERVTFQFAESLGKNSRTTVVVSLRDTTIESGKRQNFLDVRQSPVVALTAPPFLEVAAKRFRYAQDAFQRDPHLWRRFQGSLGGQPFKRVLDFAEILAELILSEESRIAEMITALSGTNMRRALSFLSEFSTSPWTDLNRMFRAYEGGASAKASSDDFLRSVLKRDKRRYIEDESAMVMNLFRADGGRVMSYFVGIRMLQFLDWNSRRTGQRDVAIKTLLAVFTGIGYPASDVRSTLDRLGQFGLVGSLSRAEPPWQEMDSVRLGAAGEFYLYKLIFAREYLFNVVDDSVIYDADVFAELRHAEQNVEQPVIRRLQDRLHVFLHYLRRKELDELQRLGAQRQQLGWIEEVSGRAIMTSLGRGALTDAKPEKRHN